MEKLSFDYDAKLNCQVAYVDGFRVRAEQDNTSRNPWGDIDGLAPLMAYFDRRVTDYGELPDPIAAMSDSFINRKWRELCKIFDMPESEARDLKRAYGYSSTIAEVKRDLLDEWLGQESGQAAMRLKGELYGALGWPVYSTTSRGYCQGDWAELIAVFTPEHAALCGIAMPRGTKATAAACEDLKGAADLWGQWAWGDVYTAVIDEMTGSEVTSEYVECCGGFYGTDHEASGLAEYAESEIAAIRATRLKARAAKLKDLIRARVPVAIRADILKGLPL